MVPPEIMKPAVDAAIHAGKMKTANGEQIAAGIWILVALASIVAGVIIRFLPKWRELGIGQRKDDLIRLGDRVDKLETSLKGETAARVQAQLQLSYLVAAFGMVSSELERQDPGNIVIRQARSMVAKATGKDGLSGDLIEALNMEADI